METKKIKIAYQAPTVEHIVIDNDISLILVSGDPGEPTAKEINNKPECFNINPYNKIV